jgi:fermentation-respiration switch protein FrsA (DUF1100 family)
MARFPRNHPLWLFGLPLVAAAGAFGALEVARSRFQHRRLFAPQRYPEGTWQPRSRGLAVEDCWFKTSEGHRLHGWWLPHPHHDPQSQATILYCHGNSGSLGLGIDVLQHFRALRTNLFAFDYRGYGRSDGKPSETGLFQDVRAAFRFLVEEMGLAARSIVIFGHSLGGAVAVDAARELPVAGLVVQASFTDVREMARTLFPRLPMHWVARNQFRTIDKITAVSCPKLFIHGTRDETVPFSMGRDLYRKARKPKQRLVVPRGGHNDLHLRGGVTYLRTLQRFLDSCVPPRSLTEEAAPEAFSRVAPEAPTISL